MDKITCRQCGKTYTADELAQQGYGAIHDVNECFESELCIPCMWGIHNFGEDYFQNMGEGETDG